MDVVFVNLLNMSIAASWLILAVIIIRMLLKKTPKWINCILWGIVAVRLVCPFSFESMFSLIPSAETINYDIVRYSPKPTINSGVPIINHSINPILSRTFAPTAVTSANPLHIWMYIAGIVWMIGLSCLLCYALISFFRLRRKVSEAVLLRDNIWVADMVKSPFILGVIYPQIYLSSSTEESQIDYILAHEQAHIKRKDHWWKLLGYILLAVYWFNPLSWAAYNLFCRDIELACDEKVVCELDEAGKKIYSNALLSCSMQRRVVMACPLAFGETAVKERIKSVLNYKKTTIGFLLVSIAICIAVAVCFLTNPVTSNAESGDLTVTDEGKTIFAEKNPSVEWWTYDEYAEWLDNEKNELSKIIGSQSWTPSTGWFTWTQEKVDETIALYEETLEKIKAGYKISKTVDGSSDIMLMQNISDYDVNAETTVTSEDSITSDAIYNYETGTLEMVAYGYADDTGGSTFEEIFAKYKDYGITYVEAIGSSGKGNVYYNGQLVNIFSDVTPGGGVFSFQSGKKGGINVRTAYTSDGKISGIEIVK